MIVAVDFDGFLFHDGYPFVGKPINKNIRLVKRLQKKGARLILWTCREEVPLDRAVLACNNVGIEFVAVNQNDPELNWQGPPSRKIYADVYLDDRANVSYFKILKMLRSNHGQ